MKKLFLIIISCIILNNNTADACGIYYPSYSDYALLYFMPHLFLDEEMKEMAKDGLYETIIRKTQSPYIKSDFSHSEYLDDIFRKGLGTDMFINFYEKEFEKSQNLLARSHYAGSIFHASRYNKTDSIIHINDSIPASMELAIYHFSLMLEDPSMMYWVIKEVNYMLDFKKCDWNKVRTFCKNQDELDRILSIEAIRFSNLTASVLENFINQGGDINSQYFKLLLIKSTIEFENKFKPHIKSKKFKDLYNYNQHIAKQDENIYLDFLDFQKLLFKLNMKDRILLHVLRGYSAFIGADFNTAKKEYKYSKYLLNQSNKTEDEKKQIKTQIDFLNIVIDSYNIEDNENYNNFIKNISNIINRIPKNERIHSYYKVGLDAALKKFDLVTAYQFSHFDDWSSQQILEILMNKIDLHKVLEIVQNQQVLFPDRFPVNHEYIIIETLALKFLRTDDFDESIRLLELLKKDSIQLEFCQIPYYSNNDFYKWFVHKDTLPPYPNHDSLAKLSWPYDINCYDWTDHCRYDEFTFEYKSKETKHNKITFIKEIKKTTDSITQMIYGDKKANLYYKLSQMYKEHFFNYNCIWGGDARWKTRSDYYFNFSLLGENFLREKMHNYIKDYSTISKAEEYIEKAMRSTRNKELLAKYNFELLEIYEESSQFWFTRRITTDSIVNTKEEKIKQLIDSLYTHTNYFNEVIKECGDIHPKKEDKTQHEAESNNRDNSYNDSPTKKKKYIWEIVFILSISLLIVITKVFIKKQIK